MNVFVIRLSSDAGIPLWQIVWVMTTNCCCMSDVFTLCIFMWACFPLFDSEAREWEARFYQIHSKYMLLLNELQTPEGCQNSPRFRELVARLMGDSVTENIPSLRWVSVAVAAAAAGAATTTAIATFVWAHYLIKLMIFVDRCKSWSYS